jgi:hypothetical protein
MGTVYSRKRSPYLWIKYYQHGRPVRESTGTKNEVVARRMLRAREGDVERGIPIDPKVGLVTFHEAAEDMLREDNVRVGFFEHEQYEAVLAHLPEGMRPAVTFAYVTGWRINSEVLSIQWRQVDLRVG